MMRDVGAVPIAMNFFISLYAPSESLNAMLNHKMSRPFLARRLISKKRPSFSPRIFRTLLHNLTLPLHLLLLL